MLRQEARDKFEEFYTHSGFVANKFPDSRPPPLSSEEKSTKGTAMTFEDVSSFINETKGMLGCLRWYEMRAWDTTLYKYVARPLLSLSSVGSMDIEWFAKPLKYVIQTKDRNNISDEFASMLLRILINLGNVDDALKMLKKN